MRDGIRLRSGGVILGKVSFFMGKAMDDFIKGFIKGAKETPRGFFSPLIAVWRLLISTTESLIRSND
jgi:hypothetical protein